MIRRHLILRAVVTAVAAASVAASAASAMPRVDAGHGTQQHVSVARNPALVDAAAHAATMRAIGAKRTAHACE